MDALLKASGTRLARMIRDGKVSSREVVETHIAQIRRVNHLINAVVEDRFDRAREEADAADRRLQDTAVDLLPPLHGVPCTIKECFSLTGMPNTSGMVARKGIRAEKDATAVSRLREAGAIPLGVTNVSELCMWMETSNNVYGRTNNPYDPGRIVGGSSGGEGAIVGAGGSPFGLGSDVGGSIRMPAFFNGVFGHKPTGGLIPGSGQYPIADDGALRYLTTGPLARNAEDLMPLVRILAGPDGQDTGCFTVELGDPADVRLEDLTVYVVKDNGVIPVDRDMTECQEKAAEALAERGARVQPLTIKGLRRSLEVWASMLGAANETSFGEMLGQGRRFHSVLELGRWAVRRSEHTLPAIMLSILELLGPTFPRTQKKFVEYGKALREKVSGQLGTNGVILYPPYPTVAPRHHKPLLPFHHFVYTAIFNVLEFPVTQVPLGLNPEGLPLGVQVVGQHKLDHMTIAVALALQEAFGGWKPPATCR